MEVHRNRLGIIFGCLAVVAVTLLLDSDELTGRNEVLPVSTNVSLPELPTCWMLPEVCNNSGMPETRKKQLKAARRMYGSIFGMGGASFACCVMASFVLGVAIQCFVIRYFQVSSSGQAGDIEVSEPAWVCWWSSPFRFTFPLMTMKLYVSRWHIVSFDFFNHEVNISWAFGYFVACL